MNTSPFFIPLQHKCPIYSELLSFAKGVPDSAWEIKQGFMVTEIPDALIDREPNHRAVKQVYKVMHVLVCLSLYTRKAGQQMSKSYSMPKS